MKAIIGKKICKNDTLPKGIIIDKIEIDDAKVNSENVMSFSSMKDQILHLKTQKVI